MKICVCKSPKPKFDTYLGETICDNCNGEVKHLVKSVKK